MKTERVQAIVSSSGPIIVPADGAAHTILSVPVPTIAPILLRVLFLIRDPTLNRHMWSAVRSEVVGDPVTATLVATQNEFQITQPGFTTPPTVGPFVVSGSNILYQLTNPVGANSITVVALLEDYYVGPS